MYIVESYPFAVFLCFITMLCWGSWANTQKLASKSWPFQLFYWDYALGIVILTLIFGLTVGSMGGDGRSFITDLAQADWRSISLAILGGVIFNLANILIVIAIDIAGMAIAFPVGIGIALVQGVIVNYIGDPVGDPLLLFGGVGLVAVAIVLDAVAYGKMEGGNTADKRKGLIISIIGGILMGLFYRFVADSMATDFYAPEAGRLTPYSALFVFSIGVFISNFVFNSVAMYRPLSGQRTTYSAYFTLGTPKLHFIGILGGVIWGVGMSLSIMASDQAGFAISYGLGQGATMVAAFWGVFIWKEFAGAPKAVNTLITFMFIFFMLGLTLIVLSKL
ncbi:MAG: multidrug DMT transporter permease [Saprospiraceae bacterium]|nr:multidrug DMT transporter permease [Saprospiraceae bacterium]